MKKIALASILSLCILSLAAPRWAAAQTPAQSASGSFRFLLEDGLSRYVEFNSMTDERGVTSGQMTFTDDARISDKDTDDPDPRNDENPPPFYIKAEFDAMTTEKNRSIMSGVVRDSSHQTYIGKWVQLVVEDNGQNLRVPDKLTWSICRPEVGGWVPSDYERKYDDGAYMSWWATDAERRDDVGIPSKNLIPGETRGCQILPIWSYDFVPLKKWEGDIRVVSG